MPTAVTDLDLPVLDVELGSDFDRVERYRAAAGESWIAKGVLGYVVTSYDDVVAILRDKRWHNAAAKLPELMGVTDEAFLSRRRVSILSAEGEMHTRLRRLVAPAFSPRNADRLRPFMREVMDDLVDAVALVGRTDFVTDICEPYPIPIICELLGAPKSDWKLFSRWAADVLRIFNGTFEQDIPFIARAQDELDGYTRELIADRRSKPADDLLTALIAAEESGDRLSTDELVMMVEAVIVGGTDTTRNQLGCSVALFSRHPDQWKLLGERPELAPRAVEETMRYLGAIRATGRFASQDIVYRDVLFPAGTFIGPALAMANRDGSVWEEPDRFDITREPSGQPQLTFGSGIHYCLGAWLARAELQEALPLLARRMPDLVAGEITWKPETFGIWGPDHLPLEFRPS